MSSSRNEDKVTEGLRRGLESSNLMVGIDFTKKNEPKGLHHIGDDELNPYEQIITIIGRTLALFNEHNMIPCYGFGDASTHDQDVFSFYPNDRFCNGHEEVLSRYKEIVPHLKLSGPTSFSPVIEMATTIVERSGGRYHVLLIITCGQVTRGIGTEYGKLSPQEKRTVEAIEEASVFPLSIIIVGVGDGPWDTSKDFYNNIMARAFDNVQFVNFSKIMSRYKHLSENEAEFVVEALMKIPSQYTATVELGLSRRRGNPSPKSPLFPPINNKPNPPTRPPPSAPLLPDEFPYEWDKQRCPICMSNPKDMTFGCGHLTCCQCGKDLHVCPICRRSISTKIKLYGYVCE